ncbi:hypothetical protein [Winogradskya humida]|uniref:Uncharacterized protein n=1 Tax=Winogradskya humida TaxID=113566 RepID=A0ABQ3ZZP6_9ACTN|nr:hypothetical protein [Actinoplanes humidus]GIE23934.1 hypothetical protein Ahu01nite_070360 [Actinoplanes humidus]
MHDPAHRRAGVLADSSRLRRLPFSTAGSMWVPHDEWREAARINLTRAGITPYDLARTRDPVSFADIVSTGRSYGTLYALLRDWADDEREPWDVIRRKIRFIGVVSRRRTSPNTQRWQQRAVWTSGLPSSMDPVLYSYLADRQEKLTVSFGPVPWAPPGVRRDDGVQYALAEAVALVDHGRRPRDPRDVDPDRVGAEAVPGEMGRDAH